jgi:crotonobetainyl-CoA:carnitine CoA-transferase CaiB-like acyl-CoA transferase
MPGPLSHIKVLDLSRILAGPWSTQMLGDLGAEIIKIERPGSGDDTRSWGPPFVKNPDGSKGDAAYYLSANRNKTARFIDISTEAGQAEIKHLVKQCDIVVENYKVGGLKKYGLDYQSLSAINPSLIYCSITGFGQTGPYVKRTGYDFMIQAMGGMMSITGEKECDGGTPQKVGVAIADIMTGMYATIGILAALSHREKTGEGQYIDLALLDCQIAMLANHTSNYLVSGDVPQRLGNAHVSIVPYQTFKTRDGDIVIAVGNDTQFQSFALALGKTKLATDKRFATNEARVNHRDVLVPLIATKIQKKTTNDWLKILTQYQVPCGPVNSIDKVLADPQVIHRKMVREIQSEDGMMIPTVANPINFSKTPIEYRKAPPKIKN